MFRHGYCLTNVTNFLHYDMTTYNNYAVFASDHSAGSTATSNIDNRLIVVCQNSVHANIAGHKGRHPAFEQTISGGWLCLSRCWDQDSSTFRLSFMTPWKQQITTHITSQTLGFVTGKQDQTVLNFDGWLGRSFPSDLTKQFSIPIQPKNTGPRISIVAYVWSSLPQSTQCL